MSERVTSYVVAGKASESLRKLLQAIGASQYMGCCTMRERVSAKVVAKTVSESFVGLLHMYGASHNHRCCMGKERVNEFVVASYRIHLLYRSIIRI